MIFMTRIGSTPAPDTSSVTLGLRAILPSAIRGSRLFYSLVAGWAKPRVPRDAPRGHFNKCLPRVPRGSTSGFSLLELLLVLFIMGLMTTTAMLMTGGVEDQSKYDETKRRMELVKRAIVGDVSRTVNGMPDVSGFTADVGRPPKCLAELIVLGPEISAGKYQSPCDATEIYSWAPDGVTGLHAGWRGPYLDVLPESNGTKAFRDGYGTSGVAPNYGWGFDVSASGVVALSSVAADVTDTADDMFDTALLTDADYAAAISAVKVNLINRSGSDLAVPGQQLVIRFYYPIDGKVQEDDSSPFSGQALSAVQSVQLEAAMPVITAIPVGTRGYVIVCETNSYVYDSGNCATGSTPTSGDIVHFTVVPRAQSFILDWIIE